MHFCELIILSILQTQVARRLEAAQFKVDSLEVLWCSAIVHCGAAHLNRFGHRLLQVVYILLCAHCPWRWNAKMCAPRWHFIFFERWAASVIVLLSCCIDSSKQDINQVYRFHSLYRSLWSGYPFMKTSVSFWELDYHFLFYPDVCLQKMNFASCACISCFFI